MDLVELDFPEPDQYGRVALLGRRVLLIEKPPSPLRPCPGDNLRKPFLQDALAAIGDQRNVTGAAPSGCEADDCNFLKCLLGLIHNSGRSWALENLLPCQVRPENSGDSLACRNVHLIERELDARAGVCLVTAELREECQSPNPKTARNSLVLESSLSLNRPAYSSSFHLRRYTKTSSLNRIPNVQATEPAPRTVPIIAAQRLSWVTPNTTVATPKSDAPMDRTISDVEDCQKAASLTLSLVRRAGFEA